VNLLNVRDLRKYYPIKSGLFSKPSGFLKAVDGVNFSIEVGETLGLVGESGCGKTTIAKIIVKLEKPTSGRVFYRNKDIHSFSRHEEHNYRKEVQMVFQDPHSSLNPRMTARDTVEEALIIHGVGKKERDTRVKELFDSVGLGEELMNRYPHELSGGQKQRISIARALAVNPKLIIADEPVSALDISVQAQILNLLLDLKSKLNLSYLFIAHNLPVIRYISDRVAVIYRGRIVEYATTKELFSNALHPYTEILLSAIPAEGSLRHGQIKTTELNVESGCDFQNICNIASEKCRNVKPDMVAVNKNHFVSCWNH
jgi:oligopeptide/dipeptide ABC transporter ATP-binding protein